MNNMTSTKEKKEEGARSKGVTGKTFRGVVVSAKMKDTAVVAVTRFVKHPKYHKFMKLVKRHQAHDPGNAKAEGDKVEIRECRPISKRKHFRVVGNSE